MNVVVMRLRASIFLPWCATICVHAPVSLLHILLIFVFTISSVLAESNGKPAASKSDTDAIVAAFDDLSKDLTFRCVNKEPNNLIIVNRLTSPSLGDDFAVFVNKNRSAKNIDLQDDLAASLISRNSEHATLHLEKADHLALASVSLEIEDLGIGNFRRKFPAAKAYVQAWLPGYSQNMKKCTVLFVFGPTAHGGFGLVLLDLKDGKWFVKSKQICKMI